MWRCQDFMPLRPLAGKLPQLSILFGRISDHSEIENKSLISGVIKLGSAAKKQRRIDNQILSQFYIDSRAGRARLKDVEEVKDILIRLGEPFSHVLTDRELFYFFLIFSWNLSFAPEDQVEKELQRFLEPYQSVGEGFYKASRELILSIAMRKKQMYPQEHYTFGSFPQEQDS